MKIVFFSLTVSRKYKTFLTRIYVLLKMNVILMILSINISGY